MARSPFTLVAAVTAALPGAEVTGARPLSAGGDGRFDSAVASLADGRELAIRVADDDETSRELAAEALALRALTAGAREILPFRAPDYVGETQLGDSHALVTGLLPGFQIDAANLPAGRGAAPSTGAAIAAMHALPVSVVRGAGLAVRDTTETRDEIRRLIDRAASTGRVPARLTVRWRTAADDDELWRFEPTVVLGGVQASSFLFEDDPDAGPRVVGVVGWHGLAVGDPAVDLAWLSAAPEAAADVHAAYARASGRSVDEALQTRARLHAELEFARWLVHGDSLRRPDIVDDAAALLESLATGVHDDLTVASRGSDVDSAIDALDRVPDAAAGVDTSMQTDAYRPEDLWPDGRAEDAEADAEDDVADTEADGTPRRDGATAADVTEQDTQDLSDAIGPAGVTGVRGSSGVHASAAPTTAAADEDDLDSVDEAQRAARAALQRWTSSSSE